jgi:hypothetical protein
LQWESLWSSAGSGIMYKKQQGGGRARQYRATGEVDCQVG